MSSHWLTHLNPEQKEAALHNYGPLLILAGAGSGKTTVLVSRTGRLIEEKVVAPDKMCVLTFTNKAARELKQRVSSKLGKQAKGVWSGTFHSFGLQILKIHHKAIGLPKQFGVIDPSDAGSLLKEQLMSFHLGDKTAYDADKLISTLSRFREERRTERNKDDEYEEAVEWLIPRYEKKLRQLAVVDFDDLLLKPLELLETPGPIRDQLLEQYQQIMVDEFQDTNATQMRLVRALTQTHHNLIVVGDDDQSIYGWRGACIKNILDFPKFYDDCKVVRLERNYRSRPAILKIANEIIKRNSDRHTKKLVPTREETAQLPEVLVFPSENEEAEGVATDISLQLTRGWQAKDIAVLFRSNNQGALIEAELRRMGHPYSLSGGTAFFDRREIRDVIAYLKCAVRPQEVPFRRILNVPSRGIGDKTIDLLTQFSEAKGCNFFEASEQWSLAGIDSKAGQSLNSLLSQLKALPQSLLFSLGQTPAQGLLSFLKQIHYLAHLEKTSPNALTEQKRWKHLEIFADILGKYLDRDRSLQGLTDFLERMDLRDAPDEETKNEIQLMTLHACKGLEFPVVYFMGIEEDLIPHKRLGSDISEERRLFYVGVTRAKERLIFTRCRKRKKQGRFENAVTSRFLLDVPDNLYTEHIGGRPSEESGRKSLLQDLYKKLDQMGV
jgi:DNA helicase-2/ATP-dependent DNA helicase PcrA